MTGTPRNVRGAGVGAEIFRLPSTPGDDDSIFFRGPIDSLPSASRNLFRRPLWTGRDEISSVLLVRAKLWDETTAVAAFMYSLPWDTPRGGPINIGSEHSHPNNNNNNNNNKNYKSKAEANI